MWNKKKTFVGNELFLSTFINCLKQAQEMLGDIPVCVGINSHTAKRIGGIAVNDADNGKMLVIGLWKE